MAKIKLLAILSSACLLASCACAPSESQESKSSAENSDVSGEVVTSYDDIYEPFTVTFHSNGGTEVPSQTLDYGQQATRPDDPVKEGYIFLDWYWDEVCVTPYNFSLRVFAPLDLYAGWKAGSSPVVSSSESSSSGSAEASSSEESVEYVDYYLAGSFTTPQWGVDTSYRLYKNPNGNDLGYMKGLSLSMGAMFKVVKSTDGSTASEWYGGDPSAASGQTGWHTDTNDNNNVVIDITGSYTLYLNASKQVWLSKE